MTKSPVNTPPTSDCFVFHSSYLLFLFPGCADTFALSVLLDMQRLVSSCKSDELHSGTRSRSPSETQSEVHSECDGVRRRHVYRPIETDWQGCLNEVSFEEAVLTPNGPAVVHQGRKSPRRGIYIERQSCSRPPAVS